MPSQSRKYLWGGAVGVIVVVLLATAYFFFHHSKVPDEKNECDAYFGDKIKDRVLKDVFNQYVGNYSEVWISTVAMDKSQCSYFAMKKDGEYMHGFRSLEGNKTVGYGKLAVDSNGFIDVFDSGNPAQVKGKIYPLFSKQFVLGNIFCFWDEKENNPHWRSVISVREDMSHNKTSYGSLVDEGVKMFENLGKEIGIIVNDGDYYEHPCFDSPQWHEGPKK